MSRRTRTDYNNIFDNGLENMSDLMQVFTRKNRRVHKIFDDNDDDDDAQINEKSYGLRMITVHDEEESGSKPTTSEKENNVMQAKKSSTNVKALSPIQISEALPEQILETRSPFKHPSQLSNRQNLSLRRSLFQQQPKNKNVDLICSTPSSRHQANDFFGSSSSTIENLSPIKKGLSNTVITEEDLNGMALIAPPESNKKATNGEVVHSLQNLEEDLREQYQINQGTPKKSYSKTVVAEKSRRSNSERKNVPSPSRLSYRSEPIPYSQPTQNCSVLVEAMEISREAISIYRRTQMSRLSTSNLTNVNTINMIETPIIRPAKKSCVNDSLLAKKLALCESDSEVTDDESFVPSEKIKSSRAQQKPTNEAKTTPKSSEPLIAQEAKGTKRKTASPFREKNAEHHHLERSVKRTKGNDDAGKQKKITINKQTSMDLDDQPNNSDSTNVETDDQENETSDLSDKIETPVERRGKQARVSDNLRAKESTVRRNDSEITNDESQNQNFPQTMQDPVEMEMSGSSDSETEEVNQKETRKEEKAPDNAKFKKPETFKKPLKNAISCNISTSSAGSLVSSDIVESFRTLRRPTVDTQTIPESSKSLKATKPKGAKKKTTNPNTKKIAEYLSLEQSVKRTKGKDEGGKQKKRTLYNQTSMIDEDQPESSVASNDNQGNYPSDNFNVEETPPDRNDKQACVEENLRKKKRALSESDSESTGDESEKQHSTKSSQDSNKTQKYDTESSETEYEDVIPERKKDTEKTSGKTQPSKAPSSKKVASPQKPTKEANKRELRPSKATSQKAVKRKAANPEREAITSPKRMKGKDDGGENKKKTRFKKIVENDESDSSVSMNVENDDQGSETSDQGFQSREEDEYDDVWYDPAERGCQRTGLRVRKFMKSRDGRFAIRYDVVTEQDLEAMALQKKYNIKESDVHEPTLPPYVQPGDRLARVKALVAEKQLNPLPPPTKKKTASKASKKVEKINDGASTSRQAMETESVVSGETARTNETQSGMINRLLQNFNRLNDDNSQPINLMSNANYAITQINRLVWHSVGEGVFYTSFKENSFDGFLKIVKGGYKKGARTKHSVVKMTLLCGIVEIKIDGIKIRLENLGFITISKGQSYRISNSSDETAIILMTRLDEEVSDSNLSSSQEKI